MKKRQPNYPIQSIILDRWSPRAMSGEELSDEELLPLFEAARWAPSSYNNQPWRFVYAKREEGVWQDFLNLLVPGNQEWAKMAAVLVIVLSKKTFDYNGKPSRTHSFDAGAAWENLAIEGTSRGLIVHAMQGFDYDKACSCADVPEDYAVEAMIAIGKPGQKEDLPEKLQAGEVPNDRRPLSEIVMLGKFRSSG